MADVWPSRGLYAPHDLCDVRVHVGVPLVVEDTQLEDAAPPLDQVAIAEVPAEELAYALSSSWTS